MQTIYIPKGRAREYAALAINLFTGCSHQCRYCYVPSMPGRSVEQHSQPHLRAEPEVFLAALEKDLRRMRPEGQVLLCFTTDPYTGFEDAREAYKARILRSRVIDMLHDHRLGVCLLSKAGASSVDYARLGPRDAYAATLTFLDPADSDRWEPRAPLPEDRLRALSTVYSLHVPTWVSLEPVIDPQQSLEIISMAHEYVDVFKVGKMNHEETLPEDLQAEIQGIDWAQFGQAAMARLENLSYRRIYDPDEAVQGRADNRLYYVKQDLAKYLEE